jgi:small subunit ribosomal protein S1
MVDRILLRELDVPDADAEEFDMDLLLGDRPGVEAGGIVPGKVIEVVGDQVVVDVGYKSEGLVPLNEWDPGEAAPAARRRDRGPAGGHGRRHRRGRPLPHARPTACAPGSASSPSTATATSSPARSPARSRAGCWSTSAINAFLPASQVDIRRPADIADYLDREVRCVILSIDEDRRNIVVSRRTLIETERVALREGLLAEIAVGQVRTGTVKNLADFGAFVDLGGIDGLLHITDMAGSGLKHPGERLRVDDRIEVMILHVDKERGKIALGLKQLTANPWEQVAEKYAVGARVTGEVVNVMSYGAFVKLEPGIEGLVHVSEMSWTRRINHPSEVVQAGDQVEVVVLGINQQKREISLGMKQTQADPWDQVAAEVPARHDGRGGPSATSPTTGPSSRSRRGSTACCTSRT